MEDIAPQLLQRIKEDFERQFNSNKKVKEIEKAMSGGSATYAQAQEYAEEIGDMLARSYAANLSSDVLPDGKFYYNIAKRCLSQTMERGHSLVAAVAAQVQTEINRRLGLGITGIEAELNVDKIDGIIDIVSGKQKFDDVSYMLQEPIINFMRSIVDDTVRTNAKFQSDAGLSPKIRRTSTGKCCAWCDKLVGVYDYDDVSDTGNNVFRRHKYCRCLVEYDEGNGVLRNVHSKKRYKADETNARIRAAVIERADARERKQQALSERIANSSRTLQTGAKYYERDMSLDKVKPPELIRQEKHAYVTYNRIKNSNQELQKRKIFSNVAKLMKDFTKKDVDIAFDHVFNIKHRLDGGMSLFEPDVEMGRSWERLITGKDIQEHDLILLRHERLEYDYMYGKSSMEYKEAHAKAEELFNYVMALKRRKDKC